ncbi:UNKNOWN [Stylonychia lemnae]|uniref:START domain-containing protein n=1 Tax=Stylonychia lemnae TaxID=5949 RepID=A0A078A1Y6_STYLE|nr:UNKNOWN [Stylonychia lemnae]|eukprot:CDW76251.1 UNKNOWN [Stylonychia lemnae]
MSLNQIIRYYVDQLSQLSNIITDLSTRKLWDPQLNKILFNDNDNQTFIYLDSKRQEVHQEMRQSIVKDRKGALQQQIDGEEETPYQIYNDFNKVLAQSCPDLDCILRVILPQTDSQFAGINHTSIHQYKDCSESLKARQIKITKNFLDPTTKEIEMEIDRKYLSQAQEKEQEFLASINFPDWKISVEDKKKQLHIWQRISKNNIKSMKAQGVIDHSIDHILKAFLDSSYQHHYDKGFGHSEVLETIVPNQTHIFYQTTKKYLLVSARDFLAIHHRVKKEDGSVNVTVFSVSRDDLKPIQKHIVRMWLHLGCWRFEPITPTQTLCTYVVEIDLGSHMPHFIVNQINKDVGHQIIRLGETVDRYLRDNPLN